MNRIVVEINVLNYFFLYTQPLLGLSIRNVAKAIDTALNSDKIYITIRIKYKYNMDKISSIPRLKEDTLPMCLSVTMSDTTTSMTVTFVASFNLRLYKLQTKDKD